MLPKRRDLVRMQSCPDVLPGSHKRFPIVVAPVLRVLQQVPRQLTLQYFAGPYGDAAYGLVVHTDVEVRGVVVAPIHVDVHAAELANAWHGMILSASQRHRMHLSR